MTSDGIRLAVEFTVRTIERRLWFFRVTAVVMLATTVGSVLAAVVLSRWGLLLAGGVAIPQVAMFLACDRYVVSNWRSRMLMLQQCGEITIRGLAQALRAYPQLPKATLEGMLREVERL